MITTCEPGEVFLKDLYTAHVHHIYKKNKRPRCQNHGCCREGGGEYHQVS